MWEGSSIEQAFLLLFAFVLDTGVGDPAWLPHPVRLIGRAIETGERLLRRNLFSPRQELLRGGTLVVVVVVATYTVAALVLQVLGAISWWLGYAAAVCLGSLCLARRSLQEHASAVLQPLGADAIEQARTMLARIVSRETGELSEPEIVRGTLETVAENSSDGVIAPLFYLALGGVPLALAYKAVNTLDSMLGYHTERYEYFGKAAARLDDLANFLPARLTTLTLVGATFLLEVYSRAYDGLAAWRIAWRDGRKHASPNAGYPEAAMAGALGVQLGGPSRYFGAVIDRPILGDARRPLTPDLILHSLVLLNSASLLALVTGVCAVFLLAKLIP